MRGITSSLRVKVVDTVVLDGVIKRRDLGASILLLCYCSIPGIG